MASYEISFNSPHECMDLVKSGYVRHLPNDPAANQFNQRYYKERLKKFKRGGWYKRSLKTFEDQLAHKTPASVVDPILALSEELKSEVKLPVRPRRKRVRNLEMGDELDLDRTVLRCPTPWDEIQRPPDSKKIVHLAVNFGIHCGGREEDTYWRGAALLALSDWIESQGVTTEIEVFNVARFPTVDMPAEDRLMCRTKVKRAGEPLIVDQVAMTACTITYFRGAHLMAYPQLLPSRVQRGLGFSDRCPDSYLDRWDFMVDSSVGNRHDAVEWLQKAITQYDDPERTPARVRHLENSTELNPNRPRELSESA